MLRFPDRRAPWLTARYLVFSALSKIESDGCSRRLACGGDPLIHCQDSVPIAVEFSWWWERHLAAIPIEAGRLSPF
jgi:hypothetical protein